MERLLTFLGYSKDLEPKNRFTYIINTLSLSLVVFFLIFYIIIIKSNIVIFFTLLCLLVFSSVFFFLKKKIYFTAKILLLLGFLFQEFSVVFLWFPKEARFNYFFFIVAPISFFVCNFDVKRERIYIIVVNALAITMLLSSEFITVKAMIPLPDTILKLFNGMSLLFTILSITVVFYFYANNLSRVHRELNTLASTDSLTNIANRRTLFQEGENLFHLCQKYDHTFTLMLFDIDHFKKINDTYGHPVGDKILIEMTSLVKENCRRTDVLGRYGGEEFAILLKNTETGNHFAIAEHVLTTIGNHPFMIDDTTCIEVTISAGLTPFSKDFMDFDTMVKKADKALYTAKKNGRNQISLS